jgi:hypothetical protein
MVRVKFLAWLLIVSASAVVNLVYVSSAFEKSLGKQVDARLNSAASLYTAQDTLLQAQRSLALIAGARDPALVTVLRDLRADAPTKDSVTAWATAFGTAAGALPPSMGAAAIYVVSNDVGTTARQGGSDSKAARDLPLAAAVSSFPNPTWTNVDNVPYRLLAVAVHDKDKVIGTVAVAFALDDTYVAALARITGTSVTAAVRDTVLGSSVSGSERTEIGKASKSAATFAFGHAKAGSLVVALPILTGGPAPAVRGRTLPIDGLEGGRVALGINIEPAYSELVEYQIRYIPGGLAVFMICLAFLIWIGAQAAAEATPGLRTFAQPVAPPPPLPASPSAPVAVSEALSALPPAPEASPDDFHFGQAGPGPAASPSSGQTAPGIAPPPPSPTPTAPDPFADFAGPQSFSGPSSPAPSSLPPVADPFAPTPMREERTRQAPVVDPFAAASQVPGESRGYESDATVVAQVPEQLLRASARPPPRPMAASSGASSEENHFQDVFREFIATRERCGEPADGLTFEKFAAKLRKNKDQLVAKYNCKTVRFQVYVKDGKAALKATPVKE